WRAPAHLPLLFWTHPFFLRVTLSSGKPNAMPLSRYTENESTTTEPRRRLKRRLCEATPPGGRHPKPICPLSKMLIAFHGNLSTLSSHLHCQRAPITPFQTSRTYDEPSKPIPFVSADHRAESSVAHDPAHL